AKITSGRATRCASTLSSSAVALCSSPPSSVASSRARLSSGSSRTSSPSASSFKCTSLFGTRNRRGCEDCGLRIADCGLRLRARDSKATHTRLKVRLTKDFTFEAAQTLPCVPEGHKCRRMHGHSFKIEVSVEGEVDPKTGWFYDHADISKAMRPLLENLDHG